MTFCRALLVYPSVCVSNSGLMNNLLGKWTVNPHPQGHHNYGLQLYKYNAHTVYTGEMVYVHVGAKKFIDQKWMKETSLYKISLMSSMS